MNGNDKIGWLKSIHPGYKVNDWNYQNVYRPKDLEYFVFFNDVGSYITIISPKQIIGIKYAYACNDNKEINRVELLSELKNLNWMIKFFKTRGEIAKHIHQAKVKNMYTIL